MPFPPIGETKGRDTAVSAFLGKLSPVDRALRNHLQAIQKEVIKQVGTDCDHCYRRNKLANDEEYLSI